MIITHREDQQLKRPLSRPFPHGTNTERKVSGRRPPPPPFRDIGQGLFTLDRRSHLLHSLRPMCCVSVRAAPDLAATTLLSLSLALLPVVLHCR